MNQYCPEQDLLKGIKVNSAGKIVKAKALF